MRRIRVWRARLAIRRLLSGIRWPGGTSIFSGNVTVEETVYDKTFDFAAWYVKTYGKQSA